METLSKFTWPAVLLLLTLGFGFWTSQLGKPYNGLLFNIHKLIALGAVILTAMRLIETFKQSDSQLAPILLVVLAAMCVIALFVSGALLSATQSNYTLLLTTHRVALIILPLSLALAIYLLRSSA